MRDRRLNGSHLGVSRHDLYYAAVAELLDDRGSVTASADPLAPLPTVPRPPCPRPSPPAGGTYTLVHLGDGRRYPLRVGINTLGRYPSNDIVLNALSASRRHCVLLVHATGGCEVYDTASRNHTRVNHRVINHEPLFPGDLLHLTVDHFLVAWLGPHGELYDPTEPR